jgi:hypothetical protein
VCVGYAVKWDENLRAEIKAIILYSEDGEPQMETLDVGEVLRLASIDLDQNHSDIKGETFINPETQFGKIGVAK